MMVICHETKKLNICSLLHGFCNSKIKCLLLFDIRFDQNKFKEIRVFTNNGLSERFLDLQEPYIYPTVLYNLTRMKKFLQVYY